MPAPILNTLENSLVAFRISNGALTARELPSRLKLLSWGENETVKGPVIVNAETVKQLAANQATLGYDRIALDFNHNTVPGSDTYQKDPVEVAAYGVPVCVSGDGLYLDQIEWTPAGEKFAANYHDLSPTPRLNAKREVVFLHSVALCRQGAVKDLSFFNASFLNLNTTPKSMPETPAAPTNMPDYKGLLATLLSKLGVTLPENPSDSDIATAVDQFKAPAPNKKEMPADDEEKMTAMAARLDRMERDNLVALAARQGKVIPLSAKDLGKAPLDLLRGMIDKLPAGQVPTGSVRPNGSSATTPASRVTALTANQKAVAKTLRISEEKYLETLNAEAETAALTVL